MQSYALDNPPENPLGDDPAFCVFSGFDCDFTAIFAAPKKDSNLVFLIEVIQTMVYGPKILSVLLSAKLGHPSLTLFFNAVKNGRFPKYFRFRKLFRAILKLLLCNVNGLYHKQ